MCPWAAGSTLIINNRSLAGLYGQHWHGTPLLIKFAPVLSYFWRIMIANFALSFKL